MVEHKYVTGALFDDDDNNDESEVEDGSSFRKRIPVLKPKSNLHKECKTAEEQKQVIQQRILESATNSLVLLRETVDIGNQAAQDLVQQGDLLQNTNLKLDECKANVKISQKHINGIKSIFSELKTYMVGKSNTLKRRALRKSRNAVTNSKVKDTNNLLQSPTTSGNFEAQPPINLHAENMQTFAKPTLGPTDQIDNILEENLNEMTQHLTQLKTLGVGIGNEINQQNELIDTIHDKIEVLDIKINKQNKEMNKLLGK